MYDVLMNDKVKHGNKVIADRPLSLAANFLFVRDPSIMSRFAANWPQRGFL
jgi:hypothetical protein